MNIELTQGLEVSSRKRRIAAFAIDHSVLSFLIVSTILLILGTNYMDEDNMGKMMSTTLSVMLPGFLLYCAKDSMQGISLGKWIMGIMVRDQMNPNEVPSFGRLLIRNLFMIISPIEFIVLAVSQDKKRLGDKVARTVVIRNPDRPTKLPRVLALAGVGVAFFAFTFFFTAATMKNSDAYKVAIKEIEMNQEILTETGGIKGYGFVPTGSVSTSNGSGQAQLEIQILGNEKDMTVSVYLTKEPNGEWSLKELNK